MRKIVLLLAAMVFSFSAYEVQAQNTSANQKPGSQFDTRRDNMQYWMEGAQKGWVHYNPKIQVKPAEYHGSELNVKGVTTLNSPDVPVTDQTDVTESENSIFVDPNNFNYVLNSNNSTSWSGGSVGTLYGASYLQSADGGLTFGGSVQGAGGSNSGDPATAINQDGRQFVGYISSSGGMGVSYSDDGTNWTAKNVYSPGSQDKNHMWVDNSLSSPYEGNLYNVWTDFGGGANDGDIIFSRSTDDGDTWSSVINISSAVNSGSHDQGCNVQTGPNGEVYIAWAIYDSWPSDETAIGFAKSTDGGATFAPAVRIIENIKGIRTSETSKNHRVNSFPSMAVDISGGSNNGNIYISWTNIGTPGINTGSNRSVYIVKSMDDGATWSTAVRVNQGPFDDDREAYFPWITCDGETGTLAAVFYDDRNTSSTDCEAFSAYSLDAGATWTDFVVSDVSFTPAAIPGLAGGYMGDYLGITSKGGMVYPCWTDNRNGLYMTYVSAYGLGLNAQFTADETEICNGSSVIFNDVSTGEPISWDWSFPGGTPSSFSGQNPPAITYSAVGSYTVTLTVSDGTENDTEVKTDFITVKDVIAEFSGTPTTVVIGNTVTFTDESSCGPTSWTWSFPGGTPDSYTGQAPPAIQYDVEGNYDVTLTVTNASGSDTKTYEDYITVMPPEFPMTNGTVTTCMGNFYDSGGPDGSYGNGENFTMTFYPATSGDMIRFNFTAFDVENNFDYLYIYNGEDVSAPLIGTYSGTASPGVVTANNTEGALTFNFTSDGSVTHDGWVAEISCYAGTDPPIADFSASNVMPVINSAVMFTDLSLNLPTSWEWSFDPTSVTYVNGTDEFSQNPEVEFNELGFYSVTLSATNDYGTDTETKTDYIDVVEPSLCLDGLYSTGCSLGDGLTSWDLVNVSVPVIECGNGDPYDWYHDYTDMIHGFEAGVEYTLTAQAGYSNTYLDVWIDYNEDLFLDDNEHVVNDFLLSESGVSYDIPLTIPADAPEGQFLMRYRTNWNNIVEGSCDSYTYGNMADFTAEIGESEFPAPTDLTGSVDENDVSLAWTAPNGGTQTGFNIYRDGDVIGNTTETTYSDLDLDPGFYDYCVTAVYDGGESYCSNTITLQVENGGGTAIFEDDFEIYNAGEQVACQNPDDWTTWTNAPCGSEDAYVSDLYAHSGANSANVVTDNDLVKELDSYLTSGVYSLGLYIYIPTGNDGYYNVLTDFAGGANAEWGFEVYFNVGGDGSVNGGATAAATFNYSFDTWMYSELVVDLDNDLATYYLDGTMIHSWQWTAGAAGGGSQLQLAALDFFGATATTSFFFDDLVIDGTELPPPLAAPTNLTGPAVVGQGSDIDLTWDAPGGGEWIHWDSGENTGNGIGLTNGGTFLVASRWMPNELAAYDGMNVSQLSFYANGDPSATYVMKIWTGDNAGTEVMSQDVATFTVDDFNIIDLDNPVTIDASMQYWFGYELTHDAGTFPAGADDGPAVQESGDMISLDGVDWVGMSAAYGLDYNWNIQAYVGLGGKAATSMSKPATKITSSGTVASASQNGVASGVKNSFSPESTKDLLSYNVYRDGSVIGNTTETAYTDNISNKGQYTYCVTAVYDEGESECSNDWVVDVVTGINENAFNNTQIYPNPATDVVNVKSDLQITNVKVYNNTGQIVSNEQVNSKFFQLNTSQYETGIYFFQIETNEGVISKRIIIQ